MDSPEINTEAKRPSCHGCRLRKQKCSREEPSCAHCRRLGAHCVYGPTRNKPGPKTGNAEKLGRRVDVLEDLIQDANDQNGGHSNDTSILLPIAGALTALTAEIGNLASRIGLLENPKGSLRSSSRELSPSQGHFPNPEPSRLEPSRKRRRSDNDGTRPHAMRDRRQRDVVKQFKSGHLSSDLIDEVVRLYFARVYWWIPILHLGRFKNEIRHWPHDDKTKVIIQAIAVASLRFLDRERFNFSVTEIEEIVSSLRDSVLLTAMNSLSLENIQALSIVAFMDIGDGNTVRWWSIIGSINRAIGYMQLNMEDEDIERGSAFMKLPVAPHLPQDWTEAEGKRRIFWNAFILDRLCSITMGCKPTFKIEDVSRRLPVDGTFWYAESQVPAPYFLIGDGLSETRNSSTESTQKAHRSPWRSTAYSHKDQTAIFIDGLYDDVTTLKSPDSSNIGGLAYFIEATEALYQVHHSFISQNVSFNNQRDAFRYLTLFKESDLKLVRWKTSLPKRWKDPNHAPDTSTCSKTLDYNMTLAHITHNTSMIFLHQSIAYPASEWQNIVPLPSSCSAETCLMASIESSNIASKCLEICAEYMIIAPQFAFCLYVSARVLLVHWRYYNGPLPSEFFTLIRSLQNMARRWVGILSEKSPNTCLPGNYAIRLQMLYKKSQRNPNFRISIADDSRDGLPPVDSVEWNDLEKEAFLQLPSLSASMQEPHGTHEAELDLSGATNLTNPTRELFHPVSDGSSEIPNDLLALSESFMEQQFTELERVMRFDDPLLVDYFGNVQPDA
ncbi:fungal-specific transcription factor domain-containing protein [Penicillium herquei]|nr:fungal-specific transcription factor domain-containing protein [Penicillium herquei]